jgi:hypothetical protein
MPINGALSNNRRKNKKLLLIFSIVFVVVLFVSVSLVYTLMASDDSVVFVWSEEDLRRAVVDVDGGGESTVIVLCCDVFLSRPFVVDEGCNVTLSSFGGSFWFFKLFGASGERVIIVEEGGWLCVDGVVITHFWGVKGGGVIVDVGGEFVLLRGKISGNNLGSNPSVNGDVYNLGGGVYNLGKFRMLGGEISDNKATYEYVPDSLGHVVML